MGCLYGKRYKPLVSLSVHTLFLNLITWLHPTIREAGECGSATGKVFPQSIIDYPAGSFTTVQLTPSGWSLFIAESFQNYLSITLKHYFCWAMSPLLFLDLGLYQYFLNVSILGLGSFHHTHYQIHIVSHVYNYIFYIWHVKFFK